MCVWVSVCACVRVCVYVWVCVKQINMRTFTGDRLGGSDWVTIGKLSSAESI